MFTQVTDREMWSSRGYTSYTPYLYTVQDS
jgi:hypothetical protein